MPDREGQLPVGQLFSLIKEPKLSSRELDKSVHDLQVQIDELGDDFRAEHAGQDHSAREHLIKVIQESVGQIATEAAGAALEKDDRRQLAHWLDQINELMSFFEVEQLK